jgi:16S rRNA processing protein RimM
MSVVEARFHGESALISLSGVAERNAAQALKGTTFLVTRSRLTPPQLDEYYWIDLIGCEVCTLLGVSLGKVDSLLSTGAHDVLSIQTVEHGETRTRLIPFVNAYVKKVDVRKKQISVEWDPAWD